MKKKETHYHSLYKNDERREQLQLILARFPLLLSDKEQIDHRTSIKHNTNGSFPLLLLACSQLERIYILLSLFLYIYTLYRPYVYERETIIIHVMWAAHSWMVESIYKHIYTTRHLIRSPDDDEKLHFSKIWFLFLFCFFFFFSFFLMSIYL